MMNAEKNCLCDDCLSRSGSPNVLTMALMGILKCAVCGRAGRHGSGIHAVTPQQVDLSRRSAKSLSRFN